MAKRLKYFINKIYGYSCCLMISCLFSGQLNAQKYDMLIPVSKVINPGTTIERRIQCFKDSMGTRVIDYNEEYGIEGFFENGYANIIKNRKKGLINKAGKIVVPCLYTELMPWRYKIMYTATIYPDSIKIIDADNKIYYEGLGKFALVYPALNRVIVNNEGYKVENGAVILDLKGHVIAEFKNGNVKMQFTAIDQDYVGKYNRKGLRFSRGMRNNGGITDMNGKLLYDSVMGAGFYHNEMILNGPEKACVIDTNLNEIIPLSAGYRTINRLEKTPYYNVQKDSMYGIIDAKNNIIVPFKFKYRVTRHNTSSFEMYDEKKRDYHYYSFTGEQLFESKNLLYSFEQGSLPLIIRKESSDYQLWKNGFLGQPHQYIATFDSSGLAYFYDDTVKGYLDTIGNIILRTHYYYLSYPVNGIIAAGDTIGCPKCEAYPCAVKSANDNGYRVSRYFYLDANGNKMTGKTYDKIAPYRYRQALVYDGCKYFYVDKNGNPAGEETDYTSVTGFGHGVRIVMNADKKQALMNRSGKVVSPWVSEIRQKDATPVLYHVFEKDKDEIIGLSDGKLPDFTNGLVVFQQSGLFGLMDTMGNIVTQPVYTNLGYEIDHYNVYAYLVADRLQGALDKKGKEIIKPENYRVTYYWQIGVFVMERSKNDEETFFVYDKEK